MNRRYFIAIVCLLLFVAAVDTIPDPPAVNPPSSRGCQITTLFVRVPFSMLEKERMLGFQTARPDQLDWFSFRLAFASQPFTVRLLPRVHHAADTSPPLPS